MLGILAGVILLLIPTGNDGTAAENSAGQSANEYCLSLEQKTTALLKELDGVKDCKVQITLVYGYEYIYAADQHINETFNSNGSTAAKETEKKYVVITSDGKNGTVLLRETMPTVQGIAVVCNNASYETQYQIISMLTALYDIPSNKISVQS